LSFISASHTHSRDSFDLIICMSKVFSMILWLFGIKVSNLEKPPPTLTVS
jgi:hypothetical protein